MSRLLHQAEEYQRMGYQPIPLAAGSKQPLAGFSLAEHFQRRVPVDEKPEWFARGRNLGIITGDLVVVDFDRNREAARDFYKHKRGILRTISLTRRGIHIWFQSSGPQVLAGTFEHGDLKASGGFVVEPKSVVDGFHYEFADGHGLVPFEELPVFQPDMVKLKPREEGRGVTREIVRNVMAYVMKIESIQGKGGSKGLVRAAAVCRDGGLTEAEAMLVLLDWNKSGNVVPEWPLGEIARACSRTYAKGGRR